MPVLAKLHSQGKPASEPRSILGLAGNRVRVAGEPKCKYGGLKRPGFRNNQVFGVPGSVVRRSESVDSSCSSDSSTNGSSVKMVDSMRVVKKNKPVTNSSDAAALSPGIPPPIKKCDWVTPYSDPLYTAFHDEEWGVPVHDDKKLFELLVFSQALAEQSWQSILNQRDMFREHFENFDPSSIAQFNEKKLLSLNINGTPLLSEQKLRAIVENAKHCLKVQKEFGSFSNYCWRFVNHKQVKSGFRYARQVPVRTPKAELISKDLMRRGFICVGPIVVYSFMQVAGLVNDHLTTCYRYQECDATMKDYTKAGDEEEEAVQN